MSRPTALVLRAGTTVVRYDEYTLLAAKLLKIDPANVTIEQRAKAFNYALSRTGAMNENRHLGTTSQGGHHST